MKILYLQTSPEPRFTGTDAVFQEIGILRDHFGGDILNIFPFKHPSRFVPDFLYGISARGRIDELNANYDAFHIYHPQLRALPFLSKLKKPIFYSVVAGLGGQRCLPSKQALSSFKSIVISNRRDAAILDRHGITNYQLILPGINSAEFSRTPPPPLENEFVLLAGSAPWTRGQFRTKGVDMLLKAAEKISRLKLVFLWRGRFTEMLQRKIEKSGLCNRVEVINHKADVNQLMQRVHATVVLAANSKLVKAYPHSLIESLYAGRPVIISDSIAMADYVDKSGCGVVVNSLHVEDVTNGIHRLTSDYKSVQQAAVKDGGHSFSVQALLHNYEILYNSI